MSEKNRSRVQRVSEVEALRARLEEAEETLRAIRTGEVDALVIAGPQGDQVFTLAGAEQPYRVFIEEMNEGALTLSADHLILYCNGRFADLVKTPLDRVIGSAVDSFIEPSDQPAFRALAEASKSGRSSGEIRCRAADGTSVPLHLALSRLPVGSDAHVCVVATDLTERKQREDELRRAHADLEKRIADRTATLATLNQELGASRIAALNMMEDAVVASKAVEAANRELQEDIIARKRAEAALREAHGELERRVEERTAELAGANEALRAEIAERTRAEEEIHRLNEDLARRLAEVDALNKELESFSYSVSHDLRAPIRAVEGFGKALLEDCADALDEHGKHCVDRIRAGSQHMAELIEDLLRLSRVTASEMSHETVDLGEMAREVAAELRKSQPERRVECIIADGLMAEGDRHLLRILLRHLLDNAWKFTSKHLTARMELGAAQAEDGRVFFVRDDGAGLDMAYAGKLFAPFQRLHAQAEFPGTGIGLATVQRIVRRHGGRVWVEAAVEQGATFYFTLQGRAT